MNNNRTERKKSNTKSFYTAVCICVAMVGFACYFAYTQTADRLSNQLDNISISNSKADSSDDDKLNEVVGIQTDIPKETQPVIIETTVNQTENAVETHSSDELQSTANTEQPIKKETKAPEKRQSTFIFPIDTGCVITPYSNGELVKSATTGAWQTHNGVDVTGEIGTEVKSIYSGTVISVTNEALWGVCVTIDHGNGITARYCGLSHDVSVEEGAEVNGGTVIGTIGNTCEIECETEPHLHFEIIQNGGYADPIAVLNIKL